MMRTFWLWLLSFFPHFTMVRDGKPYMTRYWVLGGSTKTTEHRWLPFNLFLHCFHADDWTIAPHNHPWDWARSLILSGSYREHRIIGYLTGGEPVWRARQFGPGQINKIGADDFHYATLNTAEVWTLFLVGTKHGKSWGFLDAREGFVPNREYVARHNANTN
jgi:hypothetical protein